LNPFAGGPPTPGDLDGKADGDDSVSERKKKLKKELAPKAAYEK